MPELSEKEQKKTRDLMKLNKYMSYNQAKKIVLEQLTPQKRL